jgi:hypothetical protein
VDEAGLIVPGANMGRASARARVRTGPAGGVREPADRGSSAERQERTNCSHQMRVRSSSFTDDSASTLARRSRGAPPADRSSNARCEAPSRAEVNRVERSPCDRNRARGTASVF